MSAYVVIWSAKVGEITGNNVTDFDSEEEAKEYAEHLLRLKRKYTVMVCKVVSYHLEER